MWYNKGLSTVAEAMGIVRRADPGRRLTLCASHTGPAAPPGADETWSEPAGAVTDADYVDWCLAEAVGRRIDILVPGRRQEALSARRSEFMAAGIDLAAVAAPETLRLFDRKDALYEDLAAAGAPVALPAWRTAATPEQFDRAFAELSAEGRAVCVKPVTGIFGAGFRLLDPEADDFHAAMTETAVSRCAPVSFRRMMAEAFRPRPVILMHHLPGPERSVDCASTAGRPGVAVCRVKHAGFQIIESAAGNPAAAAALAMADELCRRYGLDGAWNMQCREDRHGAPRLLEVNARMAGGVGYASVAGVDLPYQALALRLGWTTAATIPPARAGTRVRMVQSAAEADPDPA